MLLTHSREESGKFGYTADANTTINTTNTVTIVVLTCMSVGADKKVGRSLAGDEAEEEDSEYTGSELFFELPSGRWRYLKDNECFRCIWWMIFFTKLDDNDQWHQLKI